MLIEFIRANNDLGHMDNGFSFMAFFAEHINASRAASARAEWRGANRVKVQTEAAIPRPLHADG